MVHSRRPLITAEKHTHIHTNLRRRRCVGVGGVARFTFICGVPPTREEGPLQTMGQKSACTEAQVCACGPLITSVYIRV